ncbi:diamine acetyltransferase 2-like isoform X2 [Cottoperca gobio]|uniref:Diamine acetyltransferase 2-like isoform X2 n=1 Tax=Cottoperca gobio TaxID=56716 RepID=A0A6J2R1T0_COTGO|nr:diamine acetyltransferase 2-like isoform X2 [Cottoperca gobio]
MGARPKFVCWEARSKEMKVLTFEKGKSRRLRLTLASTTTPTEHCELERDGFCQNPFFECLVAEVHEEDKAKEGFTMVGYALYFYTYSTWKGRSVYLEDLYVMPEFRGKGIGKGLLGKVAEMGKKEQCVRLQLSVLEWNTPSRDFYAAKGALDLTDNEGWHFIRFDGQNLDNLANEAPKD